MREGRERKTDAGVQVAWALRQITMTTSLKVRGSKLCLPSSAPKHLSHERAFVLDNSMQHEGSGGRRRTETARTLLQLFISLVSLNRFRVGVRFKGQIACLPCVVLLCSKLRMAICTACQGCQCSGPQRTSITGSRSALPDWFSHSPKPLIYIL